MPAQHRLLARRPGLVLVVAGTASLRVDTVVEQQAHVAGKPGAGRGPQLLFDHLTRRRVHGREQAVPPTAVTSPEAELEQQLEPAVVSAPMAVVQRLFVVGVGAVGEQQASERDPVTVSRRIALARSERAGERGERRAEALPQEAGVCVRAVVKEHPRGRERVASGMSQTKARVGEIQERLPVVGTALPVHGLRIALEELLRGRGLADGGDRVDACGWWRGVAVRPSWQLGNPNERATTS